MKGVSKKIIHIITILNKMSGSPQAAYTFDAGPNAVIYLPKVNMPVVLALLLHYFPSSTRDGFLIGSQANNLSINIDPKLKENLIKAIGLEPKLNSLKYILHTTVGSGPKVVDNAYSLIDYNNGYPKNFKQHSKL